MARTKKSSTSIELRIPIDWTPRAYQRPAWDAMQNGCKRGALVWHRRAGKDLFSLNFIATQLFKRVGLYWHLLPTYAQGRKAVWNAKNKDGRSFLSYLPMAASTRTREDEMTIWFRGPSGSSDGSIYQVIGADDANRLVGANPIGVVFSEWSLMDPTVYDLIRPILAENDGWALFIYTARGRNHGYKTYEMAKQNPDWFCELLTVDDTLAVTHERIQQDRDEGMPEELIRQEYWNDWNAPLVGAYYGDQMAWLRDNKRIGKVPHDPAVPVTTAWDLGMSDATAIWFVQQVGQEVRFIDYYQAMGVGLDHYAKMLSERNYLYANHILPWDAQVRELGTGRARVETLRSLGLRNIQIARKLPTADGISAVRMLLPRSWMDEEKCETGIRALTEYTKERIDGKQDYDGKPLYKDSPSHDWTSHAADAVRTLAVGIRPNRDKPLRLAPKLAIA